MSSLVLYGNEFDGHLENGLAPESFRYRILAEGDSWMDRSAMFHTSLLQKLAPKMDAAGDEVLIINLSRFGDTMRRKSLDWRCPAELFMPESFDFFKHHHQLVALRT